MEKETARGPKLGEVSEARGIVPLVLQAGSIGEILQSRTGHPGNQPTEEGSLSLEQWEGQWKELLRTLESLHSPWGIPHLPEKPSHWEDAKAFLASFEQVAEACRWPQEEWVTRLLPALSGEAEWAFNSLAVTEREDYGKVKLAILRRDTLSQEKQRQQFRNFCYQEAEGPRGAYSRLQEMCRGWLRVENHNKEQILELLILEQLLNVLPPQIQSPVRESGPESCSQAVALAEEFLLRQEKQVPLVEVAASQASSESKQRHPTVAVDEQERGEAILLVGSMGKRAGEFQEPSSKDVQKEESTGNVKNPEGIKRKEENIKVERGNKTIACQEGDFREIPGQEERPTKKSRNKGLYANQTIRSSRNENKSVAFGKTFIQKANIVSQKHICAGEKPHDCLQYGKSFYLLTTLTSHQRSHSGDVQEKEEDEELHQLLPHKAKPEEPKENFSNQDEPKRQEGNHMAEKRDEQGIYEKAGDFCEIIHPVEETFKCLECGVNFSDQTQYNIHLQMHSRMKIHKCLHCEKSFLCRADLLTHHQIHTEEKPYSCSECDKSFSQRTHLIQHQRIHTGEKPYKCSECGKSFKWNVTFQQHLRTHAGEKSFQCSECGKSFKWNVSFQRHLRTHAGEKPFQCSQCGKKFSQSRYLQQHQRTHTGEKPFECSECGKRFIQKSCLQQHQRMHMRKNHIAAQPIARASFLFPTLKIATESTQVETI
ncbi:zinc finger protein 397-like isoform X2 [Sphaerodactylus townsendi]|uniref:zinc finger protein 397-like isoform X2 n=1 Tax=Sphaerodactylus townsendi TaxID=933632 RepID=UPI002025CF89|nr:zinc finger protein 397-like isoform X2 [Sphaerodactylus townsendi]